MGERQTFRYGSKASNFNAIIQGPEPIYLPNTATQVGVMKTIVAEFGDLGPEYVAKGDDGNDLIDPGMNSRPFGKAATIRGHFFDSRAQQESKGWTDEEHDRVVARLEFLCKQQPGQVWRIEDVKHAAPWPTYDDTPREKIVEMAIALGLVGETLNYEPQNANRSTIVGPLLKHVEKEQADRQAEDALVA